MRIIPLLTALFVTLAIYLFIFEREDMARLAAGQSVSLEELTDGIAKWRADQAQNSTALSVQERIDANAQEQRTQKIRVVATHSEAQDVANFLILRGETEATRQVDMRAETSGQVISEPLRKGRFIARGDILCGLDPGTREAELTQAKARLNEAKARVPEAQARLNEAISRVAEAKINDNAARKLSQDGFASETRVAASEAGLRAAEAAVAAAQAGLESARSGIESARAAVASAQKEIDRLTLRAPFDGILESDTAEIGSLLQPGALCATILQLHPMKLVAFVPEADVARIRLGALARASLVSGDSISGEVSFISRASDPLTRTFRVEINIDNHDLRLRDGQTAEIAVASDGARAHRLPQSALTLNNDGVLGVRAVTSEKKVKFYPAQIVMDNRDGALLTGLPDRLDVILIGQEYVIDGVEVDPIFRKVTP